MRPKLNNIPTDVTDREPFICLIHRYHQSHGSGFLMSKDLVMTNYHVLIPPTVFVAINQAQLNCQTCRTLQSACVLCPENTSDTQYRISQVWLKSNLPQEVDYTLTSDQVRERQKQAYCTACKTIASRPICLRHKRVVERGFIANSNAWFQYKAGHQHIEVNFDPDRYLYMSDCPHENPNPAHPPPALTHRHLDFVIVALKAVKPEAFRSIAFGQPFNLFSHIQPLPSSQLAIYLWQHPTTINSKRTLADAKKVLGQGQLQAADIHKIKPLNRFEIHHSANTHGGSSGAPLINEEGQLIGLHRGRCINTSTNHRECRVAVSVRAIADHLRENGVKLPTFSNSPTSITEVIEVDAPIRNFTGRKAEIARLKRELIDGWSPKDSVRCCVLTGLGGVGKSELAIQFANQFHSQFGLIYWISEANQENALRALATDVGCFLDPEDALDEILTKLFIFLERAPLNKPPLLILDSFTRRPRLPRRNCSILITSPTDAPWEQLQTIPLGPLNQDEAVQLIQKLTQETDLQTITALIKTLGTFPLALTLACASIKPNRNSIANYLKQPNIQALLKEGTDRHPASLEASWKIAVSKLGEEAQMFLNICAHLAPHSIPRNWTSNEVFDTLCDYQLIRPQKEKPFSIHPLLQAAMRDARYYSKAVQLVLRRVSSLYATKLRDGDEARILLCHAQTLLAQSQPNTATHAKLRFLAVKPLLYLTKKLAERTVAFPTTLLQAAVEEAWWSNTINTFIPSVVPFLSCEHVHAIHTKNYQKLSTKALLEPLRRAYISALSHDEELVKSLAPIPNRDGSRYEQQLKEDALLQQLKSLTTEEPSPYKMRIAGSDATYNLDPKVLSTILDAKGQIKRNYKNSLHAVSRLKTQSCDLHFKQAPTHPLMEYAVYSLTSRIMGPTTPATTLIRLEVTIAGKTYVYPVLVSETIEGLNLKDLLIKHPKFQPDVTHLTWQTLIAILTKPGDGRPSNYIVNANRELIPVDNDVSFVEPIIKQLLWRTVNFHSILYCLEPQTLDTQVIEQFLKLSPELIIQGWIDELIEKEQAYCALFSKEERDRLYKTQDGFTPTLLLRGGTLTTLYLQFHLLQNYLHDNRNKALKPLDLLQCLTTLRGKTLQESRVGHRLFKYYQSAINNGHPLNRLLQATRKRKDQSMTTPQMLKATVGRIPSSKEIEDRELFSLEKAKQEFYTYSVLRVGNVMLDRYRGTERLSIDFSLIRKDGTPDLERQEAILIGIQILFKNCLHLPPTIILKHCTALTPHLLIPFLHKNLIHLDLTGSGLESLPKEIETDCPKLRELYLSCSPNLRSIDKEIPPLRLLPLNLRNLKFLHAARCPQLSKIRISAPRLKILKLNHNPQFTDLEFDNLSTVLLAKKTPKFNVPQWIQSVIKERELENVTTTPPPSKLVALLKMEEHHWNVDVSQGRYSVMGHLTRSWNSEECVTPLQELNLTEPFQLRHNNYELRHVDVRLLTEALKTNSSLQILNIVGSDVTSIGPDDTEAIAHALIRNSSLQILDLQNSHIFDKGANSLAKMLTVNFSLKELNLSNCWIAEEGIIALLKALKANTSLTMLDLSNNYFKEFSIYGHLWKLLGLVADILRTNSSLQTLNLKFHNPGKRPYGGRGPTELSLMNIAKALSTNSTLQKLYLPEGLILPKVQSETATLLNPTC